MLRRGCEHGLPSLTKTLSEIDTHLQRKNCKFFSCISLSILPMCQGRLHLKHYMPNKKKLKETFVDFFCLQFLYLGGVFFPVWLVFCLCFLVFIFSVCMREKGFLAFLVWFLFAFLCCSLKRDRKDMEHGEGRGI